MLMDKIHISKISCATPKFVPRTPLLKKTNFNPQKSTFMALRDKYMQLRTRS